MSEAIRLVLSDVDGTLVTPEKVLTPEAIDAVRRLHERGILFALTSSRPPRGMTMLVEPLQLTTPLAGFNGGQIVDRDLQILHERTIDDEIVRQVLEHPQRPPTLRLGLPGHSTGSSSTRRPARGSRVGRHPVRAHRGCELRRRCARTS